VRISAPNITREQVTKLFSSPDVKKLPFEETKRLQEENNVLFIAYTANQFYFRPKGAELNIYPPASQPGGLSILSGQGRIISQSLNIERREFVVDCAEPVRARIETYRYPHWVARLNGREIKIDVEAGTGLMLIDLPAGMHSLLVTFERRNQLEIWARRLSLLAWLLFICWMVWRKLYQIISQRGYEANW
jgi:hypothetical protein